MKSRNDIEVLIEGRKYTICGFESDEYLQQIASYINRKFAEFKKKEYYHRMDLDVRNVLLAINIADDYFKTKKKAKDYRTESQEKDKTVLDMKHKIIDLQEQEKNNEKKMDEDHRARDETETEKIAQGN